MFPHSPYSSISRSFVQAAGRPTSPSFYANFNRNFCSIDSLDMFTSGFVTLFFVALVAVNVVGYPVPMPIRRALAKRGPAPFEPIRAYVNRDYVDRGIVKRQGLDINNIPEEQATKAPDGDIVPYAKRQGLDINNIPEEQATKAPDGDIVPYAKRQGLDINNIPEEQATKAPDGDIVPYAKRLIQK